MLHVQELYNRSGNPALIDNSTVDAVFALFTSGLNGIKPAPAPAPVREGFITENNRLHRERLAQLEEATPVTVAPVPPVAKGPVPLTRDQESYLRALERQQADARALHGKASEAATV